MLYNIQIDKKKVIYTQVYNKIREMIESGLLPKGSKLISTRELASMLEISRSTVIAAYELLEKEGLVYIEEGKGTFVSSIYIEKDNQWNIDWDKKISDYANMTVSLDIIKTELKHEKGFISFKSIAPDDRLFDNEELKRAFLNTISLNGNKLLNYGYAKGYDPFIKYLLNYMANKGVEVSNKDILITNGFTEGMDIVLASITEKGDKIICENPTHNTALKLMKLNSLDIMGINCEEEVINFNELREALAKNNIKAAYFIPSYHNPTGRVMSYEDRNTLYNNLKKYNIPIIEDGFNEELQHLSDHISPITAISGRENGVIYIGSLSKILFPGMRIGWILADKELVKVLESVKRSRNIHTSVLDQAIFLEYLKNGGFERYVKRIRGIYKEKHETAIEMIKKHIPYKWISKEVALYILIKLDKINSRELLERCHKRGVVFTPGDIFYTDDKGADTLRLGFSRLSIEEIKKGITIIGEEARNLIR